MRIIANQADYDLPEPIGMMHSVCIINRSGLRIPLNFIDIFQMYQIEKSNPNIRCEPYCYSFYESEVRSEIIFHPIPDREYEVEIQFYPPMKMI